MVRLSIFARYPQAGKAKTRLIPALGENGAAATYSKLLRHTVQIASDSALPFDLRVTGDDPAQFRDLLDRNLSVIDQGGGDLGDRMARAPVPGMIIGSDAPGLTAHMLIRAASALSDHDAVIGPATDGGYYLIGFASPQPQVFAAMTWSTADVFAETMRRMKGRNLSVFVLPELSDIDTIDDLTDWPQFLP